MSTSNPENTPPGAGVEHLNKLEAIVQRGLDTEVDVGHALAEISDTSLYRGTHQTFEAYLRDRWGMSRSRGHQLIQGAEHAPVRGARPEALTDVWERAHEELGDDEIIAVDIRLTVRGREQPAELGPEAWPHPWRPAELEAGELLRRLRWLLTQASGTIANTAHQVETCAAALDDDAREQLLDDVLILDEELATLKALLVAPVDWDAEYRRLLAGEIGPYEPDADDEGDE